MVVEATRELRNGTTPRIGELFANRYQIEGELGEGGFGIVYAARDHQLDRDVAIKVLAKSSDATVLARFLQEAKTVAALDSEHVVTVHEVALAGHTPYLVMERLRGRDLAEVLRDGPLPVANAVDYVLQAMLGLAHAHGRGVIHRDLKPRNLFLAERADGSRQVKVLDFGIAKSLGSDLTESGTALGTARYMAPEQLVNSRTVDTRADVWALGAVLYELIAGKPAFDGSTPAEVGVAILTSPHAPLQAPAAVARAVDRCLDKEPATRCANLVELARLLGADADRLARIERALGDAPTRSEITRIEPVPRRDRTLVLGCVILAVAGVAFGIAMALRTPRVEQVIVIVDAPPVIVVDAAVVTPDAHELPLAPDAQLVTKPRPPPKVDPLIAQGKIEKICNIERSSAPLFLKPGVPSGAYGCHQIALLGCAGVERDCTRLAITDAEKLTCRTFLLKIKQSACP